jgi:hypothetical protein
MDVASTLSSSNPRCTKCRRILDSNLDMTRTTRRYYKNCLRCREKKTASNRKRRPGLFPQFNTIAAESRSPGLRETIAPVTSSPSGASSEAATVPPLERPTSQDPWSIYLEAYNSRVGLFGEGFSRRHAARVFIEATEREARHDAKRRGLDPNTANEVIRRAVSAARERVSREENGSRTAMDARHAEERRREINRAEIPGVSVPTNPVPANPTPARAAPVSLFSRIPVERQRQASTFTSRHDSNRTNIPVVARPVTNDLRPGQSYAESGMSASNEMATHGGFTNTIYGSSSPDHTPGDPAPIDPAPTATSPTNVPDHVPASLTSTLECSVCSDEFSPEEFPRLGACSHDPRVCQECLLGWLNQRMASTTWEQIQCPSSRCTNAISHDDVKRYAPLETFVRYATSI